MKKTNKVWSTKVKDFVNYLNEKKILLMIIVAILPMALSGVMLRNNVRMEQTVNRTLSEKIDPLAVTINAGEERELFEIEERALAAYTSKFKDLPLDQTLIDKLNTSAQNTVSLKAGLRCEEIRERFFILDPKRTLFFESYFDGNL